MTSAPASVDAAQLPATQGELPPWDVADLPAPPPFTVRNAFRVIGPGAIMAATSIGGGEWLETLPDGLDSDVGERGARLSMGQRQLVSLLRVMLQKPAIFILDEATASIDPFTEMQIQEAIALLLKQSTSILIAHRLSTIQDADMILVLDKGTIVEQGNHSELMEKDGVYASLVQSSVADSNRSFDAAMQPSYR